MKWSSSGIGRPGSGGGIQVRKDKGGKGPGKAFRLKCGFDTYIRKGVWGN